MPSTRLLEPPQLGQGAGQRVNLPLLFLPNWGQPKVTAVAKSGSKPSGKSEQENDKNTQASLKALEMLSSGALSEKSALAAIGHIKTPTVLRQTYASRRLSWLKRASCQKEDLLLFWAFKQLYARTNA